MTRLSRPLAAMLLAVTPIYSSTSQTPRGLQTTDSVPMALATALAASGGLTGSGDPQIFVGSWPEWVANKIPLPPAAKVLGAAVNGSTVIGVITMPALSDTAAMEVYHALQAHAWTTPPSPMMRPAFIDPTSISPTDRFTVCGGEHQFIIGATRSTRADAVTIVLRLADATMGSPCDPRPLPPGARPSPYPSLVNPPRSTDQTVCIVTQSMMMQFQPMRVIHTKVTAGGLLDDFGRQLADSGWKPVGDDVMAIRHWTKTDSSGNIQHMELTIIQPAIAPQCRVVQLRTSSPPPPMQPVARQSLFPGFPGVPALIGPPDQVQAQYSPFECGPQWPGGSGGSQTRLLTALTPDAVLEHYSRQLAEMSWTAIPQRQAAVGRTWTRRDARGTATNLQITVGTWSGDSTCRGLFIQNRALP